MVFHESRNRSLLGTWLDLLPAHPFLNCREPPATYFQPGLDIIGQYPARVCSEVEADLLRLCLYIGCGGLPCVTDSFSHRYQQILHRNLVYLATIADSNQNMQSLLPAVRTAASF